MQQKNATMVIVGGGTMSESLKAAHEFARMREKRIAKVN